MKLWQAVSKAASAAGWRAWIFSSTSSDSHFTEFVEWQSASGDAIIGAAGLSAAYDSLNSEFPFEESDTWKEVSP